MPTIELDLAAQLRMNRSHFAFFAALFLSCFLNTANAQGSGQSSPNSQVPNLTASSNLVLVPVLVKSKDRKIVFSLAAEDFILTDNGIPQAVRVEEDALGQPLALAVIVQTGGQGAYHLRDYRNLGPILDAVIGGVSHRVAVIGFDSTARLVQDFTSDTDTAAQTIANLH